MNLLIPQRWRQAAPRTLLAVTLLLAGTGAVVAAPAARRPANTEAALLAALATRYDDAQVRMDPVYAGTLSGDHRFDDQLPISIAPAQRRQRFAMYRRVQRDLATIARQRLTAGDQLTYDLLAHELRTRIGFERFPDHLLPLQQMDAIPVLLALFGGGQSDQAMNTVADHEAYLRRIRQLPAWSAQAIVNMREGLRQHIVPPRPVVAAVLAQLKTLGPPTLADSPFLAPIRHLPAAFSAADRQRLSGSYQQAVATQIAPAMQRLAGFVETQYLPAARDSAGWGALPDGPAWYRQWVQDQTTTEMAPQDIHALGLREVARLHSELAALAPRLGYDGDPQQLLAWVAQQPRFRPFTSEAQILDAYRALNARVQARLPLLFGRQPRAALDIQPEPALTRATASDHYSLPAPDGSRPGLFWAVINDPADYDSSVMVALFLHEGQPGHHFQMALQQEMALPQFRKRTWINAFGEGWALYAETLGREMGLYDDPVAVAGSLRLEMLRAARLVVDTGLHAQGWTRDQAVAYWMHNVGSTEAQARNQIHRYMAWPAQALGYKLGALKIQQLRERAKTQLGERFRLAAFHDAVLAEGALPLSLLEQQIERWIASQR